MVKRIFVIILFCFLFLTGCASSPGFFYWELGTVFPEFVPDSGEGTIYLDTVSFNLYRYENDVWISLGNIKGKTGDTGSVSNIYVNEEGYFVIDGLVSEFKLDGLDGIQGPSGNNGKNGKDGVAPKITVTSDSYLAINGIKTTLKVKTSNRVCKVIDDYDGDLELSVGDEVKCGTEYFNVISITDEKVSLFAKYNLDVGKINDVNNALINIENPSGLQKEYAKGWVSGKAYYGVLPFADVDYWDNGNIMGTYNKEYPGDVYDSNSILFNYMQDYKKKLKNIGLDVLKTRLLSLKELNNFCSEFYSDGCYGSDYSWLFNSSFWLGTAEDKNSIWSCDTDSYCYPSDFRDDIYYGIRPVIEISRSDITDDAFLDLVYTATYCVYDGELEPGTMFYKGQYAYMYTYNLYDEELGEDEYYYDPTKDGWMVRYNGSGTGSAKGRICKTINGKPITSTAMMYYYTTLSSVDLSTLDTSHVTHMNSMFEHSSFDNLDLSNFDTSNVVTMNSMFKDLDTSTLNLESFDTSNVVDMKEMFSGEHVSVLSNLNLSNFNTSKVTNMENMFLFSSVPKLDLSNFDTSKVTDMSGMFRYTDATEIIISNKFNTSKVTDMFFMFADSDVTSFNLNYFDTRNVTDMSSMFANSVITRLDLSSFNTSKVTDMSYMFSGSHVKYLTLSSFNTSSVTNMRSMFANLYSHPALDLVNFDTKNVISMNYMFYNYQGALRNVDNFNTTNLKYMSYMFAGCDTDYFNINFDTSNVEDMSGLFSNTNIRYFGNYDKLNTQNVTNMSNMFSNAEFDLFNNELVFIYDTSKVIDMSNMFTGFSYTGKINLSNFKFTNTTNLSYMFYKASASEFVFPIDSTSKVTDTSYMFASTKARTIDFELDTSNLSNASNMFYSSAATKIKLSVSFSKLKNMDYMFANTAAEVIDLSASSSSPTNYTTYCMFANSSNLRKIYVRDLNLTSVSSPGMFYGCTNLEGGEGTYYNTSLTDNSRARIDDPSNGFGYFSYYIYLVSNYVGVGKELKLTYINDSTGEQFYVKSYQIVGGSSSVTLDKDNGIIYGESAGLAIIKTTLVVNGVTKELYHLINVERYVLNGVDKIENIAITSYDYEYVSGSYYYRNIYLIPEESAYYDININCVPTYYFRLISGNNVTIVNSMSSSSSGGLSKEYLEKGKLYVIQIQTRGSSQTVVELKKVR